MSDDAQLGRLHYELIRGVVEDRRCPSNAELAARMGASRGEVEELLRGLAEIHGVVLHPSAPEPWILHPFSLTPTLNWVEGERGSWWTPCIWCGFGVCAVEGGRTRVHTRFGAESEPVIIEARDGVPERDDVVVHFSVPPRRAWDSVHHHCSRVLPFRSANDIDSWCERYGIARGEAVPVAQVSALARAWYGSYADREWRKWTVLEAQRIFESVGLTGEFWKLENAGGDRRY